MSDTLSATPERRATAVHAGVGQLLFAIKPATLLPVVIVAAMAGQLWFALARQVNWDEFYFLARVLKYQRGELQDALQTFHVHLFGWLALIPGNEIDQVVTARLVMLALEAGTLAMIFVVARRFASRTAALCAVAAYVMSSNVLVHGASFRFDPVATFLLMSSLALLVSSRLRLHHTVTAGILIAVAGLITIKSVFYLPVILAAAFWRFAKNPDRRATLAVLAGGGIASCATFLCLYFLHAASLQDRASVAQSEAFLSHSASTMINWGEIASKWPYLAESIAGSAMLWAGIIAGIVVCARRLLATRGGDPGCWIALAFAIPLLTVLFYRNSFPYYYVFALAPASVLLAIAVDTLAWSVPRLLRMIALTCVLAGISFAGAFPGQAVQRSTLRAVHEIFPRPVPYIDQFSMVGGFPKAGFFMSTWGTETYLASGAPSFPELLQRKQPVFVLVNASLLDNAMNGTAPDPNTLLKRDIDALRENYIHHWGPIWVAGKSFAEAGPEGTDFEIAVAADYTVEANDDVVVDGMPAPPGSIVHLEQGAHRLHTAAGRFPVLLRWGANLALPAEPPPEGAIFNGF